MYLDAMVDSALVLCNLHNRSVALTKKNSKSVSGAQVCSNSFPGLLLPPKKFDMSLILQVSHIQYIYRNLITKKNRQFPGNVVRFAVFP